jgi:Flp pilus assembly CpaF family ATPase
MGPDRVIVGEIRGAEVVPMLLAMSQGNDGSMSTLHADSSAGVFSRLQMYMAMTPERFSIEAANLMTANAVDVVVHVTQLATNERVVTSIREVTGTEGGVVTSHETFAPDRSGRAVPAYSFSEVGVGRLVRAGLDPRFLTPSIASNWTTSP